MEKPGTHNLTVSFGLSLAICSLLNAALVVVKESSQRVAGLMQRLTGHHWITHCAAILVIFFGIGFSLRLSNSGRGPQIGLNRLNQIVIGGVLAGIGIILVFYAITG